MDYYSSDSDSSSDSSSDSASESASYNIPTCYSSSPSSSSSSITLTNPLEPSQERLDFDFDVSLNVDVDVDFYMDVEAQDAEQVAWERRFRVWLGVAFLMVLLILGVGWMVAVVQVREGR